MPHLGQVLSVSNCGHCHLAPWSCWDELLWRIYEDFTGHFILPGYGKCTRGIPPFLPCMSSPKWIFSRSCHPSSSRAAPGGPSAGLTVHQWEWWLTDFPRGVTVQLGHQNIGIAMWFPEMRQNLLSGGHSFVWNHFTGMAEWLHRCHLYVGFMFFHSLEPPPLLFHAMESLVWWCSSG